MLSGRGLCDELITRPEESYRLWCVMCDLETSRIGAPYIYDISNLRVKIYIKTAPTCFGAVTPLSGGTLFVLTKVTVVILTTVTLVSTNNALPDDGITAPKHVTAVLM